MIGMRKAMADIAMAFLIGKMQFLISYILA